MSSSARVVLRDAKHNRSRKPALSQVEGDPFLLTLRLPSQGISYIQATGVDDRSGTSECPAARGGSLTGSRAVTTAPEPVE